MDGHRSKGRLGRKKAQNAQNIQRSTFNAEGNEGMNREADDGQQHGPLLNSCRL
jgi:hypothetical protein